MSLAISPPPAGHLPPAPLQPLPGGRSGTGLIDIVSGSFGAGHDAVAHEVERRLRAAGYETRVWDIVDLMPARIGRALRAAYLHQVQTLPATWTWTLRGLERHGRVARGVARVLGVADPGLLELAADGPDAIVSTHPFASQALGRLRQTGAIGTPVVTYLTDMSVHPLWVHPAVDLHLALHELPAAEARRRGARATRVIRPAVPDVFSAPAGRRPSPLESRRALGLPVDERLVLVTGGSCGIGDLERAAAEIAATGVAMPVVLCGHNERLLRRIRTRGPGIALGWTDDMCSVLNAVDAVVQNAGGSTSLETLAAGVPILTYRCLSGHGETNAQALHDAGLVPWVRSPDALADGLRAVLASGGPCPSSRWADGADVVDAILSAARAARVASPASVRLVHGG